MVEERHECWKIIDQPIELPLSAQTTWSMVMDEDKRASIPGRGNQFVDK